MDTSVENILIRSYFLKNSEEQIKPFKKKGLEEARMAYNTRHINCEPFALYVTPQGEASGTRKPCLCLNNQYILYLINFAMNYISLLSLTTKKFNQIYHPNF